MRSGLCCNEVVGRISISKQPVTQQKVILQNQTLELNLFDFCNHYI